MTMEKNTQSDAVLTSLPLTEEKALVEPSANELSTGVALGATVALLALSAGVALIGVAMRKKSEQITPSETPVAPPDHVLTFTYGSTLKHNAPAPAIEKPSREVEPTSVKRPLQPQVNTRKLMNDLMDPINFRP